jgi:hypothetical protein
MTTAHPSFLLAVWLFEPIGLRTYTYSPEFLRLHVTIHPQADGQHRQKKHK